MITVCYEEDRDFDLLWHSPCSYQNQNWKLANFFGLEPNNLN